MIYKDKYISEKDITDLIDKLYDYKGSYWGSSDSWEDGVVWGKVDLAEDLLLDLGLPLNG